MFSVIWRWWTRNSERSTVFERNCLQARRSPAVWWPRAAAAPSWCPCSSPPASKTAGTGRSLLCGCPSRTHGSAAALRHRLRQGSPPRTLQLEPATFHTQVHASAGSLLLDGLSGASATSLPSSAPSKRVFIGLIFKQFVTCVCLRWFFVSAMANRHQTTIWGPFLIFCNRLKQI